MTFWEGLESYGDALCVEGERELSYKDVAKLADATFPRHASGSRLVALIVCQRDVATLLGYLGALRHEIVPILLPEDISLDGMRSFMECYQPQYLYCASDRLEGLELPVDANVTQVNGQSMIEFSTKSGELFPSLALLLTTSGTTADPKLVRLSYSNLQANADSISQYLEISPTSKPITLLPFNYSFGLSVINSHLNSGATIAFTNEGLASKGFWDLFKSNQITSFYGVPYHYEILKKLRFERYEYPHLLLMAQAGGRMPSDLKKHYYQLSQEKGFRFICMYGQTEATARISYLPSDKFEAKGGSVGKAIPDGKLSIKDADDNGVGEVAYAGPNVSLGYASCRSDLALGDINEGELLTGDLGYLDDDGYLFLTGRKKRYIKVFGHNVNLDHVEELVTKVAKGAAVIGHENQVRVLIANHGSDRVRDYVLQKTSIQPSALKVEEGCEILYKPTGKIDYAALMDRYFSDVE